MTSKLTDLTVHPGGALTDRAALLSVKAPPGGVIRGSGSTHSLTGRSSASSNASQIRKW